MIHDEILKTKRHELGTVVASRKRKLQELYHATVALAGPPEAPRNWGQHANKVRSEVEFLEANDILRDRFFDVNTLFRIRADLGDREIPLIKSPALDSGTPASTGLPANATSHTIREPLSLTSEPSRRASPSASAVLLQGTGAQGLEQSSKNTSESIQNAAANLVDDREGHAQSQRDQIPTVQSPSSEYHTAVLPPSENVSQSRSPELDLLLKAPMRGNASATSKPGSSHLVYDTSPSGRSHNINAGIGGGTVQGAPSNSEALSLDFTSDPSAQLQSEAARSIESSRDAAPSQDSATSEKSNLENQQSSIESTTSSLATRDRSNGLQNAVPKSNVLTAAGLTKRHAVGGRSPMRIDTDIGRVASQYNIQSASGATEPARSAQTAAQASPERMTTRGSSGVLRQKSVSEILGEAPRLGRGEGSFSPDKVASDVREAGTQTPYSGRPILSPESASFRSRFGELREREKDRTKFSTVVFPRQTHTGEFLSLATKPDHMHRREKVQESKDYLVTLFATQANAQTPTLSHLMASSSKVLSAENHNLEYRETQDTRMLKRIYHLQNSNRWSLRQLERSKEPERPVSHWDMLLGEAKWMRADFREERKWKVAAAKNLANSCAEWVNGTPEERVALQVRVQKNRQHDDGIHTTPLSLPNANRSSHSEPTPELIPSMVDDGSDTADEEAPVIDISRSAAPAALFSLAPDDILFGLQATPSADKILEELPLYQIHKDPLGKKRPYSAILDSEWQKPLVPVSKFASLKMNMTEEGPARKRSRFDYAGEDEISHDASGRTLLPLTHGRNSLPPEKDDVALFNPENKHIISRLHAAHAFRPPSEFNMPLQSFFESRSPSQWTVLEDDQLRKLVREYEYNWSLIAACCAPRSLFWSAAERRTPWECFERWVSFEGLPGDMARHQYFRAWNARRDGAREHLEQLYQAQQQNNNPPQTPIRRRSAEPMTVAYRRQSKHVTFAHCMFKLAKRKEAAQQKQQHVASLAAMRKAAEPSQPRQRMQTPREFSAHKHKQELDYREKQILYRQQLVATQKAALAQRAAQQAGQQPASIASQASRNAQTHGAAANHLSSLPPNGMPPGSRAMSQQAMAIAAASNGTQPSAGQIGIRGANNIPQSSIQAYAQGQQRMPAQSSQDRIVLEVARLQEQQRIMQQQRQQQGQGNGPNGLSAPYAGNINIPLQPNAAMLANLQTAAGKPSPSPNGNPSQLRSSTSPGIASNMQAQQAPGGVNPVLNQIQNQLKIKHPTLSSEQIKQMATTHLAQQLRTLHTNNNHMMMNNGIQMSPPQQMAFNANANAMNPQLYAQYMRSQQASQQAARNAAIGAGGGGGSSSPNGEANGMRPGSQGSIGNMRGRSGSIPNGASQSPRPPQAQMASSS